MTNVQDFGKFVIRVVVGIVSIVVVVFFAGLAWKWSQKDRT